MNQDAKKALDTIKILQGHDAYNEADGIAIINNLMKRAVADYKQWLNDNSKEYWTMIYNNGGNMSTSKESEEVAIRHMTELQEENPGQFDDAYITKVREVMDND